MGGAVGALCHPEFRAPRREGIPPSIAYTRRGLPIAAEGMRGRVPAQSRAQAWRAWRARGVSTFPGERVA